MNILILADDQQIALQTILCLKKRHARITALATLACAALNNPYYCDRLLPIESLTGDESHEPLIAAIDEACALYRIDAILPSGTNSTRSLAAVSCRLQRRIAVPLPDPAAFDCLNNKGSFWKFLEEHGIPHPRTRIVASGCEIKSLPFEEPTVVKPIMGEGGKDVHVAKTPDGWDLLRRHVVKVTQFPLLAQEFIPGSDIDLSLIALNGHIIAWTVQSFIGGAIYRFTTNDEVLRIGSEIVARANYTGTAHIDMRVDSRDGSIKVIEFNPRFWYTIAASAEAGVNFPHIAACLAAGKPTPPTKYAEIDVQL